MKKLIHSAHLGQSLVEFAIILPALLLISILVFDLGRVVYYSSTIHNAAREAARYAIVYPNDEGLIMQQAEDYAIGLDIAGNIVVCWHYDPGDTTSFPPPSVRVKITYNFRPATPVVERFLPGGTLTVTGEAIMKLEALPLENPSCHY